jgi:hypothetical protein
MSEKVDYYSYGWKCGRAQMIEIAIETVLSIDGALLPEDSAEYAVNKIITALKKIQSEEKC